MKPYRCVFAMGVQNALEYRTNFCLMLLGSVFPIVMQTFLWNYLYANGDGAAMTGYSHTQILVYTLLAGSVSKLVSGGFEYEINRDIKSGGLNKYLIKPISYRGYRFFSFLGEKALLFCLVLGVSAGMLVFAALFLDLPLSAGRTAVFFVSLVLALVLNFCIFYCVALLSFWLNDVDLLFGTVNVVLVVASGGVFPLDIFGKKAAFLMDLLPFGYTTQFSVNIINGRLNWARTGLGLACQLLWIVLAGLLGGWMFRRGMKRFTAVGG